MTVQIKTADDKRSFGYCAAIRALVFVGEQDCDLYGEFDAQESEYEDYLLWLDKKTPVATARWKKNEPDVAKVGRIAVLPSYRGQGYGAAIVSRVTKDLAARADLKAIEMSAQDYALPFYEKLGYEVVGEGYSEANIPHHKVIMQL